MSIDRDQRITAEHLDRQAIVYVRQSSPQQVRDNVESTRVQLQLREMAIALGWTHPLVIDEDLGVSAAGFADRAGFQTMLAKVALREAGIIFCVDASRLSRNSKDWAHLFELCSYFHTLIADTEQIYDLTRPNDRLVMGIKGTVSEMELGLIRARMRSGLEAKAARGELEFLLPVGYVHDASGKIVRDPDRRVRAAVARMFDQFDRCTSVRQLAMWYRDTRTLFPIRRPATSSKVRWGIPVSKTLYNLLAHPIFAGVYVWGRRETAVEYVDGQLVKKTRERTDPADSRVFLRDHHSGYISWERYLANRTRISQNRPRWNMRQNQGAIRDGLALLAGLLRCGQCGGKIYVSYKQTSALYFCDGGHEKSSRRCFSFGSKLVDQRVSEELLRVCQPLAVEAALLAAEQLCQQRAESCEAASLAIQAVQYEVDRAMDQFDLCDPKNRLVADTLEERLNAKLIALQAAKQRLALLQEDSDELSDPQRERLDDLARDFPAAWDQAAADPKLKKRILRAAIHEILVSHQPEQQRLVVTIHWKGGVHTQLHVPKRRTPRGNKADPSLVQLVRQLAESLPDTEIARILNMKKQQTPQGLRWTRVRVRDFRRHHRVRSGKQTASADTLTMNETKTYLKISHNALLGLVQRGAVAPNQVTDFAPWRVAREQLDSERVQGLVKALKQTGRLPKEGCPDDQPSLFDGNKGLTAEV